MSRKSRPRSPFLNYVMGRSPSEAFATGVPNCTTCKGPRQEVAKEDVPEEIWVKHLAPLWDMMQQQGQQPQQIAYCPACKDYGVLGGWSHF